MKKIVLSISALIAMTTLAAAHGGGLNAAGCHNQKGGQYHCHHGNEEAPKAPKKVKQTKSISGQVTVVDGDTIKFGNKSIRLHGIDAPEKKQPCYRDGRSWDCGIAAKNSLTALVRGVNVSCTITETDKYGRGVGICSANGFSINATMVQSGWAMAYTKYSTDYVSHEATAKTNASGIWASTFDPPWVWRKR